MECYLVGGESVLYGHCVADLALTLVVCDHVGEQSHHFWLHLYDGDSDLGLVFSAAPPGVRTAIGL